MWSLATRRTSALLAGMLILTVLALTAPGAGAWAGPLDSVPAATAVSAPQGGTVTISGNVSTSASCQALASVQLTSMPATGTANLFPDGLGPQVARDASGNFHATFTIPPATPVGLYTIGLRCGTTMVASSESLNVTAGSHVPPSITVSPTSAAPGASVTIAGVVPTTGTVFCPSGDAAQPTSTAALFPPDGFGPQIPRDAAGNFHASYTIPSATTPGTYSISVRCGGGTVGVMATLQVTATAATTTTTASTTTVPATTTTFPTITLAPATTVPGSTTAPPAGGKSASGKSNDTSPLRWVAIGVLALVVLIGGALFFRHRRARA